MLSFETINELTLKVTCTGSDVLFVKAGAFIAGDNCGPKNYRFEKVLLGPQQSVGQALFGQLARRVTGENIPLMKVSLNGDSVTYYVLSDGNPVVLSNVGRNNTISVDPDAVICWIGNGHCDPSVTADVSWKTFIGQTSGESYQFEWHGGDNVTVIIQPSERQSGIRVSMD